MALDPNSWTERACLIADASGDYGVNDTEPQLVPIVESVARAALRWHEKLRTRVAAPSKLQASVFLPCNGELASGCPGRMPDFRPLAQPLLSVLDRAWEKPRNRRAAYYTEIELTLAGASSPSVMLLRGAPGEIPKRRRVRKKISGELLACATEFQRSWAPALSKGTAYTLSVRGDALALEDEDARRT